MKRIVSLLLTLVMCFGLLTCAVSAAGFPFADVPIYEWYFNDVENAYNMGLINGKTVNSFAPNDYLTYAEAVKLAACMNERYQTGAVTLKNGEPWYQTYVDYCKEEGIINKDYAWNANATRAGYMEIFANALPQAALAQINQVADGAIPDVSMSHPQAVSIYKLYRAGILQGNDEWHNCNPAANIKRSEVSAILTRMMDTSKRIRFTMGSEIVTEPEKEEQVKKLKIKEQPQSISGKSGDEVILEVWIEGGKSPYTYTWLCGNKNSAGIINGLDDTWVSGGSRSESGSFFSKLHITLPADEQIIGDTIFCVIEDAEGNEVTSDPVWVTMEKETTAPLKIKKSPADVQVLPGETAEFDIEVTGGKQPYKYQWQLCASDSSSWANLNQTSDTLIVRIPAAHPGGTQKYRCVVTDAAGASLTSDVANATIEVERAEPLEVTYSTDAAGDLVNVYIFAEGGTAPYTFTWQGWDSKYGPTSYITNWSGITIANGKTNSSLTVNTTKCSCTRYICRVEDANGAFQIVDLTIKTQ